MTVYHIPAAGRGVIETIEHKLPAVAVAYARSGVARGDALVFNAAACGLLGVLGVADPPAEVELYYDPSTNEVGVKPWTADRPGSTLHQVHPTRFLGSGDQAWTARMRQLWPLEIPAPAFMGTWHLPDVPLYRPAPARLGPAMLIFNPRKLVTP